MRVCSTAIFYEADGLRCRTIQSFDRCYGGGGGIGTKGLIMGKIQYFWEHYRQGFKAVVNVVFVCKTQYLMRIQYQIMNYIDISNVRSYTSYYGARFNPLGMCILQEDVEGSDTLLCVYSSPFILWWQWYVRWKNGNIPWQLQRLYTWIDK